MNAWQVGVLFSRSGMTSVSEISQLQGTLLAIDEINTNGGIRGKQIEPIVCDPASNPREYARLAAHLILEEGATSIFGCSSSFSRKAVLPWIERRGGLLWYSVCYEGFEYSPNIIYTGPTLNQIHVPLAEYLFRHDRKRFFFIGSDYLFPRESNRVIREILDDVGGEVLGEHYVPLNADYGAYVELVEAARAAKPDVIFSTVVGPATSFLYDAHQAAGISPNDIPIAALTTTEVHLKAAALPIQDGHIVCSPYFECLSNVQNVKFVERYRRRFGAERPVDNTAEAAYSTVYLFAKALEAIGTTDPERLRAAALGQSFQAPQGLITIDPDNNHTYVRPRIGMSLRNGSFRIVGEAAQPIKPDPYLMHYEPRSRAVTS